MVRITHLLEKRKRYLLDIKKVKESALINAPKGVLHIMCRPGKHTAYYQRTSGDKSSGTYIKSDKLYIARALAQKDYDSKILNAADKELRCIDIALKNYKEMCPYTIFSNLHPERQKLVNPIYESDEQFIGAWLSVKYEGKGFSLDAKEFYTLKNERVRSKSEILIADLLNRMDIPYRYECPLYLHGFGTIYPDHNL